MLVDLGRNDLGKVSRFGTVKVEKFHCIERYSHVMHIGSTVRGRSGRIRMRWMPSAQCFRREPYRARRRSGRVRSSGNWKITSGASTEAPSDTLILQEIWTPALPSASLTRKMARYLSEAAPGSWRIPYQRRNTRSVSTKPGRWWLPFRKQRRRTK